MASLAVVDCEDLLGDRPLTLDERSAQRSSTIANLSALIATNFAADRRAQGRASAK